MSEGYKHQKILKSVLFSGILAILGVFVLLHSASAATGINKQISFQGKVVNSNGTNVANGNYDFVFKLYSVSSGGTAIWTETWNSGTSQVTVTDGVFQVNLGTHTALPGSIDFNTDNIYLGITFHTDSEMTPRIRFTAVPYAFNADKVHGLTVTDTTGTLTIANGKTVSFADAFSTSGAFPVTMTATASTSVTLPTSGTLATLAGGETLTNKTIGSTGLTFSGAATDITTGTNESLVIVANGSGTVDIQDATNVDSLSTDTGGISIAANQSYTGSGAVTLSSGGSAGLTIDSASGVTNIATGDYLALSHSGVTGAAAGYIWYDSGDNKFKINENGTTKVVCNTTDGCGGGAQTPWTSDISAAGYDLTSLSNILFQETTGAPTGTDVGFYRDNTGDLSGNVLTGKTFNVAVNGTDEYNFSATGLAMNSNNITGAGTINGLTFTSNATGFSIAGGTASKTLTINNTLGFSGTDSTSFTFPSTSGGTVLTNNVPSQSITSTQTSGSVFSLADSTAITAATTGLSIGLTGTGAFDQTGLSFNLTNASGTNLNDVLGTGSTWKVSRAGAASFASMTSSGAIAANGGITFDNTTDTVGAHTLSGTIDANTNILTNIGNTGTDFVASTGALTLAGVLTANGGVSIGTQSLTGTTGIIDYTNFDVSSAGNVTIAAGQSYTGSGAVTLSSGSATGLTINSGTTGTIAIGDDASAETINIATGAAAKALTIGSTNTTSSTLIQSGSGDIALRPNNGSTGNVQIGIGGAGSTTPDLLALDVKSDAGDPSGVNGNMYYNANTGKFRCYQAGAWADCIGSGSGGTPAGSNTQIQYNNSGAFGANAGLTFDSSTQTLGLTGTDAEIVMQGITNEPSAASAGTLKLYSKSIAGRMMPKWVGPSGLDSIVQPMVAMNKVAWWNPPGNATTAPGVLGMAAQTIVSNGGTALTARNVATTNLFTRMKRAGIVSTATAGYIASMRNGTAQFTIGNGSGLGGFTYVARFGSTDAISAVRSFAGFTSSTAVPTNVEPSTLTNAVGMCQLSTSNNWQICYGGSAAQTPIDLGANFPANTASVDMYELILFAPTNVNNAVSYRVTRLNTGDVASGTLTAATPGTQLPASTTLLATRFWKTNNAAASVVGLDIASMYIETDY